MPDALEKFVFSHISLGSKITSESFTINQYVFSGIIEWVLETRDIIIEINCLIIYFFDFTTLPRNRNEIMNFIKTFTNSNIIVISFGHVHVTRRRPTFRNYLLERTQRFRNVGVRPVTWTCPTKITDKEITNVAIFEKRFNHVAIDQDLIPSEFHATRITIIETTVFQDCFWNNSYQLALLFWLKKYSRTGQTISFIITYVAHVLYLTIISYKIVKVKV